MPILKVYSTSGQPTRDIVVPGRSATRPYGAILIRNNVGDRQESDWAGIKAALAAGQVVICLSNYEADVLPMQLGEGRFPYGGNVRFEAKKTLPWRLVEDADGAYCGFDLLSHVCVHCNEAFDSAFRLGGHVQRAHREITQRAAQAATG